MTPDQSAPTPQQQHLLEQAIAFAGKYARTFDPELLDLWYRLLVEQTLPATATHAELAANNAVRYFVVNIIRQYQLATTGRPETPWLGNNTRLPTTAQAEAADPTPAPARRMAKPVRRNLMARKAAAKRRT